MTDALGTFSSTRTVGQAHISGRGWQEQRRDWKHGQVIVDSPIRRAQLAAKRCFDVVGGTALLLLLAPVLAVVALAVGTTSPGPMLFRQVRHGHNGKPFRIIKFRTLYAECSDTSGMRQTVVGDDRVTEVGKLLRRWNLDELPQLVNVIVGDMSLVGPRPHPISMLAAGKQYEEHVPYYYQRLLMKPGITGWAQCNGLRGPTDDPDLATARIDHDLAYIQHFSLLFDLKILFRTVAREAFGGTGV